HQVTHLSHRSSGVTVRFPAWSPDGRRLAYNVQDGNSFIVDLNESGGEGSPLGSPQALPPLSDPKGFLVTWCWSPEGRRLAGFHLRPDGVSSGIFLSSLNSRQFQRLTDFGSYPVWMRDGRRLLFSHKEKIYLVDSESQRCHEVLSVAPHDTGRGFV